MLQQLWSQCRLHSAAQQRVHALLLPLPLPRPRSLLELLLLLPAHRRAYMDRHRCTAKSNLAALLLLFITQLLCWRIDYSLLGVASYLPSTPPSLGPLRRDRA
jgi:hypothetical protein